MTDTVFQPKTALVIPTRNAVKRGVWPEVLAAVAAQDLPAVRKIVIDSGSSDDTCTMAEAHGWECRRVTSIGFNHGLTRDAAVRFLATEGYETVVFLSQDVILAAQDSLSKLTAFLWSHPVAGCYGRQLSRKERSLNAWQRQRCYPETSAVKTLNDVPELGLMTPFFSNAFAAWKIPEVIRCGGFPAADFGEDALLAAAVLNQGGAIGYCAEAAAFHDHSDTPWELFRRGREVGAFHARHPELLREFGARGADVTAAKPPVSVWGQLAIKLAGYAWGRFPHAVKPLALFILAWLLLLPALFLYDFPQRDVAVRYAPMAEAFARGEWQFAFHPRVTPLLPVTAGIAVRLFGWPGYLACQLVSALFLTLAIFPLYAGCRKVYGEKNAILSGLLFAFCAPLLRLGYYGLRESGTLFGIVLLFYAAALLREKSGRITGFLWFAAGEAVLLLSRGDTVPFALAALLALLVWDLWRHRVPWRSVLAGATLLLLLLPQLCWSFRVIGCPVVEFRHAIVLQKLGRRLPFLERLKNPHPVMPPGAVVKEVCHE